MKVSKYIVTPNSFFAWNKKLFAEGDFIYITDDPEENIKYSGFQSSDYDKCRYQVFDKKGMYTGKVNYQDIQDAIHKHNWISVYTNELKQ